MTAFEKSIRNINNDELIQLAFRTIEVNCYRYCHYGKVSEREQKKEDALKVECIRRFTGVSPA